ncbi:MAG TPA: DNA starvation/stationary phase protection protein [Rugosimonospora sp.]|nr:DNA starvation/stationary phase protection protein [Rugosimonospora sp.]
MPPKKTGAKKAVPPERRNAIQPTRDNGLVDIDVAAVGADLQDTLVELTDLHLRAKQAHWNVVGRHFRQVHLHLDELTEEVRGAADLVAERAVSIGYSADGRPGTVAKSSPLPPFPEGQIVDDEAVELVTEALADVCGHVRRRVEHTEELDPVTQDLLIQVLQTLEKQHWMFAVQKVPT